MSKLTKKRVHWTEYNGDELLHDEDVDVLTSADAVTFDDGEDLQHKYTQGQFVSPSVTGSLSSLSTTNKSSLVDAINEVKASATSNESSITSLTDRVSTAELDVDNLETRMSTAELDVDNLETRMSAAELDVDNLESRVTPISLGGTGATTAAEALANLGADFTGRFKVGVIIGDGEETKDHILSFQPKAVLLFLRNSAFIEYDATNGYTRVNSAFVTADKGGSMGADLFLNYLTLKQSTAADEKGRFINLNGEKKNYVYFAWLP